MAVLQQSKLALAVTTSAAAAAAAAGGGDDDDELRVTRYPLRARPTSSLIVYLSLTGEWIASEEILRPELPDISCNSGASDHLKAEKFVKNFDCLKLQPAVEYSS
ncbi:hypothetical protein GUJ93_ZPchr0007g4713 [Zizania palustris]|uniref:Uncharacterized protein n=1 Tax=Zizania palustris TaxID=103762 RepID=A0A8J5VRT2_ZIZPA|nr:hypothetical protein GUJ93_ZPchr0007g4713 [Zizania palustris]